MTQQQFTEYCIQNKPSCIVPEQFDGFKIIFENGEYIQVGSDYDGLTHTHQSEEVKTDSRKLFQDLQLQTPSFLPDLLNKYGDVEFDFLRGTLYRNGELIFPNIKDKAI